MLIYETIKDGVRKLKGTLGNVPDLQNDSDVEVSPKFDFAGPYFYKAPGGVMDAEGNELTFSVDGKQIIPPTWADAGEVDENYDESEELINDNETPDDDSDDKLIKVWTEEELTAETKATIAQMASILDYDGIDISMSKSAMIEAFLEAQAADTRKPVSNTEDPDAQ